MKIAILGGSFDPPHKGHITAAKRLMKLFKFDRIWLMPCYKHPFNKKLSPINCRFKMTKYLEGKNIKTSDFELKRKSVSYTIDTLKSLAKEFPKDQFFWVIGYDQIKTFKKWKDWKEIIEKFKLIIVPRNNLEKTGQQLKEILKKVKNKENVVVVDKKNFPPIRISSSMIRNRIKKGEKIEGFVPKNIKSYIIRHRLYL